LKYTYIYIYIYVYIYTHHIPIIIPILTTYNHKATMIHLCPSSRWLPPFAALARRERFIVPIRATGGGALLDMPDEVDFGLSPVKYEAPKTIMAGCLRGRWGDVHGWMWMDEWMKNDEKHRATSMMNLKKCLCWTGPFFAYL
jgi:hypothetical protein